MTILTNKISEKDKIIQQAKIEAREEFINYCLDAGPVGRSKLDRETDKLTIQLLLSAVSIAEEIPTTYYEEPTIKLGTSEIKIKIKDKLSRQGKSPYGPQRFH